MFLRVFSHHSYKLSYKLPLHKISWNSHCAFTRMENKWSNPKEIRVPVPYGFIAAKAWGDEKSEPVLALHGWQDNAGTFDKLIPLLKSELYIVAVDAPGHGLSSHKPKGAFYHYMEYILDIQRLVEHFKWETFSIMGHSMGGTYGLMYSSIYPERVKNVILLDIVKPTSRYTDELPDETKKGVKDLLRIEMKASMTAPVYSYSDALTRLMDGMNEQITEESAHILLKRGCKASSCGKGVVFSRDIRVKMTEDLQKLSHDDLKAFLCKLRCNLLIIIGLQSSVYKGRNPELLDEFMKLYEANCKSFRVLKVDGNHFVHLNNPVLVAPFVDSFFIKKNKIDSKI